MKAAMCILMGILCLPFPLIAQQNDDKNCKDHPLFTRMPDYWIHSCAEKQFDSHEFEISQGKKQPVEGHLWDIRYYPQNYLKSKPSELQIIRNFENAIKKLSGKIIYSTKNKATFQLTRSGKEFWVEIGAEFTGKHRLFIVEKAAMNQDIIANADALLNDLKTTGHASVYGIYFDTGKSDLKSESEQAIGEIAKLLKSEPTLKLYVVGHTDNVGGLESNMKLSQDRAEAVVKSLTRTHGIDAARLKSFGNGPYAPVETNDTEEGRARNRRVELVKQ